MGSSRLKYTTILLACIIIIITININLGCAFIILPTPISKHTCLYARVASPAQRLQHATTPESIFAVATEELKSLKAAHLSSAIMRIGKAMVQPKDEERRRALITNPDFEEIVQASLHHLLLPTARIKHISDFLLGIALLKCPLSIERLSQLYNEIDKRVDDLSNGQVTGLTWCWEKIVRSSGSKKENLPSGLPSALAEANKAYPFKVLVGALEELDLNVVEIADEVSLRQDEIRLGEKSITEQRLTAWQGPKPFFYSGKEMAATGEMSSKIARIRDRVYDLTGVYYDCVLINLYTDGGVGMSYHKDPDQGTLWTADTCVVSIGDTREFCLKDDREGVKEVNRFHRFFVESGDVTVMWGKCQEEFYHTVKVCETAEDAGPRISLVYKQSLS